MHITTLCICMCVKTKQNKYYVQVNVLSFLGSGKDIYSVGSINDPMCAAEKTVVMIIVLLVRGRHT